MKLKQIYMLKTVKHESNAKAVKQNYCVPDSYGADMLRIRE